MRHAIVVGLLAGLSACGGSGDDVVGAGDGLTRADVDGLPSGDDRSEFMDLFLDLELRVTECAGECDGRCDVGDASEIFADFEQEAGRLMLDVDASPSHLEGGFYEDGRLAVGGYATAEGGGIEMAVLVHARWNESYEVLEGTSEGHIWGDGLDCTVTNALRAEY
jgi:hypothetical protein